MPLSLSLPFVSTKIMILMIDVLSKVYHILLDNLGGVGNLKGFYHKYVIDLMHHWIIIMSNKNIPNLNKFIGIFNIDAPV